MPTMVTDIFNSFFSAIDNVLYYLIQILVYVFDFIAKIHIFDGTLESFYDRIFYFVSIVMIFKVSFSIIQYIINPDQFSSGERGFGKVIQGIIIALVGLVIVKPVFKIAVDIEDKIVGENIIPTLVLGIAGGDDSSISVDTENIQSQIPFYLAQAFVVPKAKYNLSVIEETVLYDGAYEKVGFVYNQAVKNKDYSALLSLVNAKYNVVADGNSDEFVFDYRPVVSTACAIFVIIMYLNFCIDLAIRTVKFGFLQIIAPIPIISMVDPKSVKSGMMSKWLKNCFSTYAGLFVRIAAVSFVIFGIRYLIDNGIGNDMEGETGMFMNIVIIFGLLMFAKDLPKLITDITGIDLKGDFKINPLKRVSENAVMKPIGAVGSAALGGAIGAAGGLAANAVALRNNWGSMSGRERFSSFLGLGTGALSAGFRGAFSKEKNILKKAGAGIQGSVAARNLRDARGVEGIGGLGGAINRTVSGVHNWAGVEEGATAYDKELSALSTAETQANDILTRANSEMIKHDALKISVGEVKDSKGNVIGHKTVSMADFKAAKEKLNIWRNMDTSNMSKTDMENHAKRVSDLQTQIAIREKLFEQAYVNAVMTNKDVVGKSLVIADSITTDRVKGLQHAVEKSSYAEISSQSVATGEEIKKFKDAMLAEQARIKNSEAYKQALVNKKDSAAAKK